MKWLFATLVAVNLIVFAGMIASKMLKQHMPVAATQPTQPTIIINGNDLVTKKSSASEPTTPPVAAASTATTNTTTTGNNKHDSRNNNNARDDKRTRNETRNNDNRHTVVTNADIAKNTGGTSQAKYRECSARVSMPEDDYHRIKGLLGRYPQPSSSGQWWRKRGAYECCVHASERSRSQCHSRHRRTLWTIKSCGVWSLIL